MKQAVDLRISSRFDGQEMIQRMEGELYLKADTVYIRYIEPDPDMGQTSTTLKLKAGNFKIIRHGDVQSEQEFILHRQALGFYFTPQGNMDLVTYTREMEFELEQGIGHVAWSYDLLVGGAESGSFSLHLDIQPRAES